MARAAGRFGLLRRRLPAATRACPASSVLPSAARRLAAAGSFAESDAQTVRSGSYPFSRIEDEWQQYWLTNRTYRTPNFSELDTSRPKFYALDMFPYPSGAGLHVGHPAGYTACDIMARYKRMRGYNVLHPMGWDAFGLPAEQFAIETGTHPAATTAANIDGFRAQLQRLGFSYDWERELSTTSPEYYRWTQWIFLRLHELGLAYRSYAAVNWCPALGTVLANEEVSPEGLSERGNHPVEVRQMLQWHLKITAYADRLLDDLDDPDAGLDWPESVKEMQRHWIGRTPGAEIDFLLVPPVASSSSGSSSKISVFSTRAETTFGACALVLSTDHPLIVGDIVGGSSTAPFLAVDQCDEVKRFCAEAAAARRAGGGSVMTSGSGDAPEPRGVWTGRWATNPVTGQAVSVWVGDYVLMGFGTGAVMCVPAHDTRDHKFAAANELPVVPIVMPDPLMDDAEAEALLDAGYDHDAGCYTGQGVMRYIDSSGWVAASKLQKELAEKMPGVPTDVARDAVVSWLEQRDLGRPTNAYRLRDWLFSRQRYWGEPFPVVYDVEDPNGTPLPLDDSSLPVVLPEMASFAPAGDGQPPLASASSEWLEYTCKQTGRRLRRETLTMPQWAGSCWYYLRFTDPTNSARLIGQDEEKYWLPVDLYVGGGEHATLHLLYARFWHKALHDLGVVTTTEPFRKLVCQGMILGPTEYTGFEREDNGQWVSAHELSGLSAGERASVRRIKVDEADVVKSAGRFELVAAPGIAVEAAAHKMSKSRGNVVNPNTVIDEFGADSLRLYIMFMGPVDAVKPWDTSRVSGVHRFLSRVWRLFERHIDSDAKEELSVAQLTELHTCAKRVTTELEAMRYNNAISSMMSFVNVATKWDSFPLEGRRIFTLLLAPFAPHLAEELWQRQVAMGEGPVSMAAWPEMEAPHAREEGRSAVAVQFNGKTRGVLELPSSQAQDEASVLAALRSDEKLGEMRLEEGAVKTIFVGGRVLNFVHPKVKTKKEK